MNDTTTRHYPNPSTTDQADFLLRLFFGPGEDALLLAIRRAHLDLSRTVHGIGEHPHARPKATGILRVEIAELAGNPAIATQEAFDSWHRKICESLCGAYASVGYDSFTIAKLKNG